MKERLERDDEFFEDVLKRGKVMYG